MAKKKVVVLGFPLDREAELEAALKYDLKDKGMDPCVIVFASSVGEALSLSDQAHVVVANTELCGDFFVQLFSAKFKGHIVPVASSRSQMSKGVTLPSTKLVFPTNYRGAKDEIIAALSKPINKTKQQEEALES